MNRFQCLTFHQSSALKLTKGVETLADTLCLELTSRVAETYLHVFSSYLDHYVLVDIGNNNRVNIVQSSIYGFRCFSFPSTHIHDFLHQGTIVANYLLLTHPTIETLCQFSIVQSNIYPRASYFEKLSHIMLLLGIKSTA